MKPRAAALPAFLPLYRVPVVALAVMGLCWPAFPQARPKTLAVIDFENANKDKTLDWLGTGTAETLITELSQVRLVRLVERRRLHDALKELNFGRSQAVDTATAQKLGKILGAEYVVVGAYQKVEDNLRLTARLMEVETARVLAPALVDGKYADALKLETQVAEKLAKEIRGAFARPEDTPLEVPTANLDAHKQFSDGAYFFREGMLQEALSSLDAALAADSRYSQAHFYKGLTLQKLGRWEDAVRSFKQALLGARTVNREKWSWEVPYEKPGSKRGVLPIIPVASLQSRTAGAEEDTAVLPQVKRVIYAERVDKDSVLHLVNPLQRSTKRIVLTNFNALDSLAVTGTERMALFLSLKLGGISLTPRLDIYGVDLDEGRLAWNTYVEGAIYPLSTDVTSRTLYLQLKTGAIFVAIDLASGAVLWQRKASEVSDLVDFKAFESVGDLGEVLTLHYARGNGLVVARGRDGGELWRVKGDSAEWSVKQLGDTLLVLDPKMKTVSGYRGKTGEKKFEASVPVEVKRKVSLMGFSEVVSSDVKEQTLYAVGKDNFVYAVAVGDKPAKPDRVLWKTQVSERPNALVAWQDRVFLAAAKGQGFVMDRMTGKIEGQLKLGGDEAIPLFLTREFLIMHSGGRVIRRELPSGETKWEFPTWRQFSPAVYLDGMVVFQSGKREVTALEAASGEVRWRHISETSPVVILGKGSVYVADSKGVSEYISPRSPDDIGLDKAEVLTQIALSLLELGRTEEATTHAQRVVRDLDPDYAEAHFALSRIYLRQKEQNKALRELISYQQLLGPTSRRAEEIVSELKRSFNLLWRADAESANNMFGGELGPALLLAASDGWFYGVDRTTGRFIWRQRIPELLTWVAHVTSKNLYLLARTSAGSEALKLWAIEIPTGRIRLFANLTAPFTLASSALRPSEDHLLVWLKSPADAGKRSDSRLYCLDRSSGKLLWEHNLQFDADEFPVLAPAGSAQAAYAVKDVLSILSAADGKEIGQHIEKERISSLSNAFPGRIVYSVENRRLAAFDSQAKRAIWSLDLPEGENRISLSSIFLRGSLLYYFNPREILAVDLADNLDSKTRIRWRHSVPEDTPLRTIRLAGDRVYALREDDVLLALDADSGKLLGEFPLLWDAESVVVKDDVLYGLTSDGHVYAMRLTPPQAAAGKP